jgi:hypothetical protein
VIASPMACGSVSVFASEACCPITFPSALQNNYA